MMKKNICPFKNFNSIFIFEKNHVRHITENVLGLNTSVKGMYCIPPPMQHQKQMHIGKYVQWMSCAIHANINLLYCTTI